MFKNKKKKSDFDRTKKVPMIRASICTGEKVAGFKYLETGKFEEILFLAKEEDLEEFMEEYGIKLEEIKKEW